MPSLVPPPTANYQPPTITGTGDGGPKPAPGKWWPDRRLLTGAVSMMLSVFVLGLVKKYTGFDPNLLMDWLRTIAPDLPPELNITVVLAGAIGVFIGQITPPAVDDIVAELTNRIIRIANATPSSPVTAMVVNEHASDQAASRDIAAGVIPAEVATARLVAAITPPPGIKQ